MLDSPGDPERGLKPSGCLMVSRRPRRRDVPWKHVHVQQCLLSPCDGGQLKSYTFIYTLVTFSSPTACSAAAPQLCQGVAPIGWSEKKM